jgi:hypothetical protein
LLARLGALAAWPLGWGRDPYRFVQDLDTAAAPGITLVKMDHLDSITAHHVETWADHVLPSHLDGLQIDIERVRDAVRQIFSGHTKQPLADVARVLERILGERLDRGHA